MGGVNPPIHDDEQVLVSHAQHVPPHCSSHTSSDEVGAEGNDTVNPLINKSWIEFEQQFVKADEHDEDGLTMDCDDWSIEDATAILSNNSSKSGHEQSSRFYSKRTIIIGNTSQYLKKGVRNASNNPGATHKWMVYVRNIDDEPDLQSYIKSVCFFLHPSYAPNDIVTLSRPPFQLTQFGWGEFPVRVQLLFKNPAHKPIDIIHNLKLDHTHTGQQMFGNETTTDIELLKSDGNTEEGISNSTGIPETTTEVCVTVPETNDTITGQNKQHNNKCSNNRAITCQTIWQSVHRAAQRVPLVCGSGGTNSEFNSYNIVKQRALEWMRAIDIKNLLHTMQIPETDKLSTREIVMWCRRNGHTPHPGQRPHDNIVRYCKQCGESTAHDDCQDVINIPPSTDIISIIQTRDVNHLDTELLLSTNGYYDDQQSLRYRVPQSLELKWIHETCKNIGIQLYPQSHDGMLLHVVDHMIFSATSQFLYQLLKYVVTMETTAQSSWTHERVIVPNMICSALREIDIFDIITNQGLCFYHNE